MRATDFIRNLLDLVDNLDGKDDEKLDFADEVSSDCGCSDECDCPDCQSNKLANSPDTLVASVNMVTKDAGGGVNGPKHPSDLRADSFSMYPNFQAKP
jgi:hypothetical protein